MKKILLLTQLSLWLCWVNIPIAAQKNLVPNFSFEDYLVCPVALKNGPPPPWYHATNYYPLGYYNTCSIDTLVSVPYNYVGGGRNFQYPKSGNAYFSIATSGGNGWNNRTYAATKLLDSLIPNEKVFVSFFVSKTDIFRFSTNNVGLVFSDTAISADTSNFNFLPLIPHEPDIINFNNPVIKDTMNWVKISGVYKAKGGEHFITIGNFRNDSQTIHIQTQSPITNYKNAEYFLDDVSVIPLDSFCLQADAGKDTTIKIGDSVFVGSYTSGIDTIKWYNVAGQVIDSLQPGFWVYPTANTFYIIEQVVNGCLTKDTINILVQPLPLKFTSFAIFPYFGGVRGGFTTSNEINVSHFLIQRSIDGKVFTNIGKAVAKNNSNNEYSFVDNSPPVEGLGVVYYRIVGVDKDGKTSSSEIKALNFKPSTLNVSVYPNPANDFINISSKENIKELKVFNSLGQIMIHQKINSTNFQLNISSLPQGVYLLRILNQSNIVYNEKFLVQ